MINNISLILSILVCLTGIVRFRKLTMPFKLLVALQIIDLLLTTVINKLVVSIYHTNALISHIQALNSYIFYSLIYYFLFKNTYIKKFLLFSIIPITAFAFINAISIEPYNNTFPIYILMPTEILLVIYSLLLFRQMLLYPVQVNIVIQSVFWYNIAILFFSAIMFMNLGLMNYYSQHNLFKQFIVYFWYSAIIIFNLLLGIAILTDRKEEIAVNAQ